MPTTRALVASLTLALAISAVAGCAKAPVAAGDPALADAGFAADAHRAPHRAAWLDGAVIYGGAPPLFGPRPLPDMTAHLDDLKGLGVDALWINPVNATDDNGGISYAITDYKAVRPDYGTMADFKRLVAEAHRRGIKVILDFVPNHTSSGHPFFQDTVKNGRKSPYWDYYMRDKDGTAQHYFDWTNLINLNYGNPAVQSMMIDNFAFWLREGDVDGFRVDAAWGVKERTPAFWPKWSAALRAIKPDVFLLAEASARDPYYVKSGFDAAYDWTTELGHGAWEHVFEEPARAGERLHTALAGRETPPDQVARFLANNDTGDRFITRYGEATQRVAATLLLTLPGLPMVYAGDDVGAEFHPYDDPPPLSWADPHHLRPWYAALIKARHDVPALRHGAWQELKVADAPGAYVFSRDAGSEGQALVALNFGKATTLTFDLPAALAASAGRLQPVIGAAAGQRLDGHRLTIDLPAAGVAVLATPTRTSVR